MADDSFSFEDFKDKLEQQYDFPTKYTFKFIVPVAQVDRFFEEVFPKKMVEEKQSKTGKFSSFTARFSVRSSDEVIEIYKKATVVPGLISL
ncbi:DUF493 family protein [Persicobacter psychrovividus]|uniref:DUF493 domain-containing protein n=1 Tax=Persicobacter psychrovividus TaxID=387638 RepID=A0ABM7VAR6_9BACT|nr:DUF493 domain-containing protein [Persicobacter psychrovividus]